MIFRHIENHVERFWPHRIVASSCVERDHAPQPEGGRLPHERSRTACHTFFNARTLVENCALIGADRNAAVWGQVTVGEASGPGTLAPALTCSVASRLSVTLCGLGFSSDATGRPRERSEGGCAGRGDSAWPFVDVQSALVREKVLKRKSVRSQRTQKQRPFRQRAPGGPASCPAGRAALLCPVARTAAARCGRSRDRSCHRKRVVPGNGSRATAGFRGSPQTACRSPRSSPRRSSGAV